MELMKEYPDKYFDLAIVDPPYGIGASTEKINHVRTKPSRPNSYSYLNKHKVSQWDMDIPTESYFEELFRVSKNQVIWGANYLNVYLPTGKGWIFWNKKNGLDNCFSDGEFAFSSKGIQSRYFECSVFDGLHGGKDRIHPTQKPVALYKWLLKNYAKEGDKILDTHLGSGSIAIACHDYKFDLTASEIDKEYFDAAMKRISNHMAQTTLF